ncbi:MAG: hypothetical protein IPI24_02660 [Ignavibacteria bacterium]|nr:hypothetical protein [Ignavibacteria bacterium]
MFQDSGAEKWSLHDIDDREAYDQFVKNIGTGIRVVAEEVEEEGLLALQPNSIDFVKWLRDERSEVSVDLDVAPKRIHTDDIWLPLVFLANNVGLPLYLSLVASYLYDKWRGSLSNSSPQIRFETQYEDGLSGTVKRLSFKGDKKSFELLLSKYDVSRFLDD